MSEDEILEIAAIGFEDDFSKTEKFFKFIRPERIDLVSDKTIKMLHTNRKILEEARPVKDILRKFQSTYSKAEVLVIWNRQSYEMFCNACKKYYVRFPIERVIVLQELLSDIDSVSQGREVSIRKMFERYHVQFNSQLLHIAKHDVAYLKELFCSVKLQYKKWCDEKDTRHVYKNEFSDVLHGPGCHCIRGRNVSECSVMEIFQGKKLCRHCYKRGYFILLPKDLWSEPFEADLCLEKRVSEICNRYHMRYHFAIGMFSVKTAVATWRVYHDEKEVVSVFHENYRKNKGDKIKRKLKYNEGFHKQDVKFSDVSELLRYIYHHDKNFFTEKKYKKRMNYLLDKVEKEVRKNSDKSEI